ncbi:MAG: peptide-methionine (R)-S-oxide reductase MsrB [Verrucomicrobia bacterium]|nr:peptide-methionine (R)-S-oxide reductase MsrB [Verrucomicrobiota bacterium]
MERSEEEWKERLTPEQYRVLRKKGTELPYTGKYYHTKTKGTYRCAACGQELFFSEDKYDSGSGWPSFVRPCKADHLEYSEDEKLGYPRIEVLCSNCHSHLGHVFEDGPKPTGKRFCINSICLKLEES